MDADFFPKWKSQVKKGTLTLIALNTLKGQEYYGYELIEHIKRNTELEIAEGTLYPLMNRLKKEGLVSSKWIEQESGIPRKYYALTKAGEQVLTEMNQYWKELDKSIQKISR
ncbi:MAG: PadR family transcriptional regulator [Bacteroidota bacterium]